MASDVKKDIFKRIAQTALKAGIEMSPYLIVEFLYDKIFDHKTISDPIKRFEDDDFPLLMKEKATFKSGDNLLTGYFYHYKKFDDKKIVVFAHGYGNGHHRYLDIIDYLAKNGLLVFAYDATSFDESQGDGIKGFPQGVIDLSNAIKYVKKSKKYKDENIVLVGHSWGGYSVGAVINEFPHISKVVSFAGFNYGVELLHAQGNEWAGPRIDNQLPYMEEYEENHFGKYANYKVTTAIKNSTTKFFFAHSDDDTTVPISIGLKLYQKGNKSNKRVKCKILKGRGHLCYNSVEGNTYFNALKSEYEKHIKNKEYSYEDKRHLLDLLIDKKKYLNMLDLGLMKEATKFINS